MIDFTKALNQINLINVYENTQTRLDVKSMEPVEGDYITRLGHRLKFIARGQPPLFLSKNKFKIDFITQLLMTFCYKFDLSHRLSASNNFKLIMFKITSGRLISGKRSTAEHSQVSATANDAVKPPLNVAKLDQSDVKLKPSACRRFNSYLRS